MMADTLTIDPSYVVVQTFCHHFSISENLFKALFFSVPFINLLIYLFMKGTVV